MRLLLVSALLFISACLFGQRFGGAPSSQPNTLASVPMQVMGEGIVSNLAIGAELSTANISNCFKGFWQTNCTWAMVTNAGTTPIKTDAVTPVAKLNGYFMPTVTTPNENRSIGFLYTSVGTPDIFPKATFKSGSLPAILIVGFQLSISNWDATTFAADDMFRIGQDPYCIVQFGDGAEVSGKQTILCHSPDGAGIGSPVILLDNGETYHVVVMANGPRAFAGMRVFQKLPSGQWKYNGESYLSMTTNSGSPLRENIWFTQHDDHAEASAGGQIRYNNFWMTTNISVWDDKWFPRY